MQDLGGRYSEEQTVICTWGYSQLSLSHYSFPREWDIFWSQGHQCVSRVTLLHSVLLYPVYTSVTVSLGVWFLLYMKC